METVPQKKIHDLTKQDKIFVEKVVETGNITKAVQEGYGIEDPNYAGVKGNRLIRKDKIINAIEVKKKTLKDALLERGINEDYLAEKVDVLLTAVDKEGNTDYAAVDKGLKHATSIYGVIDLGEKNQGGNTYNFLFNAETQADIKKLEDKIKARLLNKND